MRQQDQERIRLERVRLNSDAVVEATALLIQRYPWELMVTLTTRTPAGPELLAKRYRKLVREVEREDPGLGLKSLPLWAPHDRLRHALAWELQEREAWHLHALWGAPGAKSIHREWVRKKWNRLCGPRETIIEELSGGVRWLVTSDSKPRGRRIFKLAGIADVSLIRDQTAVAKYCSKYVAKGGQVDLFGLSRAAT